MNALNRKFNRSLNIRPGLQVAVTLQVFLTFSLLFFFVLTVNDCFDIICASRSILASITSSLLQSTVITSTTKLLFVTLEVGSKISFCNNKICNEAVNFTSLKVPTYCLKSNLQQTLYKYGFSFFGNSCLKAAIQLNYQTFRLWKDLRLGFLFLVSVNLLCTKNICTMYLSGFYRKKTQ